MSEAASTTLGDAVRARRKLLGLTQKLLGELAGCGVVFVYDVERGKATVRFDKLIALLAVLGLELVLVDGKGALRVAPEVLAGEPR